MVGLGYRGKAEHGDEVGQHSRFSKYLLLGWLVGTMGLAFLVRFPFACGLVGQWLSRLGILGFLLRIRLIVIEFFAAPPLTQ